MSDWKETHKNVIEEMWKDRMLEATSSVVTCENCQQGFTSSCPCAKKSFIDSLTLENVERKMSKSHKLQQVALKGVYYCPALKHYDYKTSRVNCDNCGKIIFNCCIGYEDLDLCMSCVDSITFSMSDILKKEISENRSPWMPIAVRS